MKLTAKKRSITGKKVKALRRKGVLPVILFGGDDPSIPLEIDQTKFEGIYSQAGEATVIDLDLNGKKHDVLISEVQTDPLGEILHADLKRVIAGEKITAMVPILVEGEAALVKNGEGILLTLLDEIEIESFPKDLPSEIKVDISGLTEVGQGIEIKDLPIDHKKIEVLDHELNELILKIGHPQLEEEEEEEKEEAPVSEEEAVAAVEATEEKPEGEAAATEGIGKKVEEKSPPLPEAAEGKKEPTPKDQDKKK